MEALQKKLSGNHRKRYGVINGSARRLKVGMSRGTACPRKAPALNVIAKRGSPFSQPLSTRYLSIQLGEVFSTEKYFRAPIQSLQALGERLHGHSGGGER